MTNKNLNLSTLAVCLACSTTLLLGACGGGGSGKTRTPTAATPEEVTVDPGTDNPDEPGDDVADEIPTGEITTDQFLTALGSSGVWTLNSTVSSTDFDSDAGNEPLPFNISARNTLQILSNDGANLGYRTCGDAASRTWSSTEEAPLLAQLINANGLIESDACQAENASSVYTKEEDGSLSVTLTCQLANLDPNDTDTAPTVSLSSSLTKQENIVFDQGSLDLVSSADASLVVTGDVCADITNISLTFAGNTSIQGLTGEFPDLTLDQGNLVLSGLAVSESGRDRIGLNITFGGGIRVDDFDIKTEFVDILTELEGGFDTAMEANDLTYSQIIAPFASVFNPKNASAYVTSPLLGLASAVTVDGGNVTIVEATPATNDTPGRYVGYYSLVIGDQTIEGNFDVSP